MSDILLITGRPGVGKTTLIRRLADHLGPRAGGFYTEEIRESGDRVGFRLTTLDGRSAVFARVEWSKKMPYRVGRYGVDIAPLERFGVEAIRQALAQERVILVDEIGKMALFSEAFRRALEEIASRRRILVATITSAPHPWADAFRRRATEEFTLTRTNREEVSDAVRTAIERASR